MTVGGAVGTMVFKSFLSMMRISLVWGVVAAVLLAGAVRGAEVPGGAARPKSVRFIYLVSQDREVREDYREAIESAAVEIQRWYKQQLNGLTFRLNSPVVEVVRARQPATWFASNPNGEARDNWGFNNALAETGKLMGAKVFDDRYVWVIYSDGVGDKGRAAPGFAFLPEDDLLGLLGKHPTQPEKLRWVAGLGHELGHALRLRHPPNVERDADAIMYTGIYGKYPDRCYLTTEDKAILLHSDFIFGEEGKLPERGMFAAEHFVHGHGCFDRIETGDGVRWLEFSTRGGEIFLFEELVRDTDHIFVKDPTRGYSIRIPQRGGPSLISANNGNSWSPLYELRRDK